MRRSIALVLLAAAFCGAALAAYRLLATDEPSLARYAPPGALLYLEAKDFSRLVSDWSGSPEKAQWLTSANYEVFRRSRLLSRLKQASDQFTAAAGLPPDMNFVSQVAGSQSALALYDIGKLQFLYITKLDSAKAEQTALLQARAKFQTRSAAGVAFYYRQDAQSGREVAFATSNGYLLLATRGDLMAGALQLLAATANGASIEQEPWWSRSVGAARQPGDLRMVLNLDKIVPSPYFRSYWIEQNITAMRAYSAAISDLYLSAGEYREERVLLKKAAPDAGNSSGNNAEAVAKLAQLVPGDAGAYQIQSSPSADVCVALLETKLLAPHSGPGAASQIAPQVPLSSGETAGAGDMETRIDQPPPEMPAQAAEPDALKALLAANPVEASLDVERTDVGPEGVFVRFHTAVVLLGSSDWNESGALSAIANFASPALTASSLGVNWRPGAGIEELDGLWNLSAAVRGKYLFLSDDPEMLGRLLSNLANEKTAASSATFIAGFNHAAERAGFDSLTALVDNQNVAWTKSAGRAPLFFSDNVASLSSVLSALSSEKIVVRDSGDKVLQTVTYEWSK
jgi:hypothetical protein